MLRTVGWHGIAATISGDEDLVAGLCGQLPVFFGNDGDVQVEAVVRRSAGMVQVDLPDEFTVAGSDVAETLRAGASRIELMIADRLPDLVAVHAGAVAIDGRALLLPGRSHAGKSTLVRALLAAGAEYLSDEFALIDADGLVHAYPRSMTLRRAGGSVRLTPAELGVTVAAGPLPVALVAVLQWVDGGEWAVEPLSPGHCVLRLVDNCVSVRRRPEAALDALTTVASSCRAVAGTRGEAAEAATALRVTVTSPPVKAEMSR